ncbi:MAG: hypothetical protein WKF42_07815 [Solirubrobacteraceae bacterium]
MNLLLYLVLLLLSGLIVGAFARLALPGKDPMTIPQTIAIGVGGSLLAGLVGALLFGPGGGGILLSIVFAAAIVYFIRRSRGGGLTRPGVPPVER